MNRYFLDYFGVIRIYKIFNAFIDYSKERIGGECDFTFALNRSLRLKASNFI